MNLISCGFCGVVLDTNRINFEEDILDMEREDPLFAKFYVWNKEEMNHSLFLECPCCESDIFLKNGDKVC